MLPRENRIKKKKDFEAIFRNSKSLRKDFFILKAAKNNLMLNRFGFVVSQKVSKKAVVRNKIRRRLTAAVKSEAKNIKNGTDLVLIALPIIGKKEFPEIRDAVKKALSGAGLIS